MRGISKLLGQLLGLTGQDRERVRARVEFRPTGESLELRAFQSPISPGAPIPAAVREGGRPVLEGAEIDRLRSHLHTKGSDLDRVIGTSRAGRGHLVATIDDDSGGSDQLDPRDSSGVELLRIAEAATPAGRIPVVPNSGGSITA